MIPTAKQFIIDSKKVRGDDAITSKDVEELLINFSKLHLKESNRIIVKNSRIILENGDKVISFGYTCCGNQKSGTIDKHSITNAYPLNKII